MKEGINASLYETLRLFRSEVLSLHDVQAWLKASPASTSSEIPPGLFLKLKRGDVEKAMSAVAKLIPACAICGGISPEGSFLEPSEYKACIERLDALMVSGKLVGVPRPIWANRLIQQNGADGYYKCASCEACWMLIEPEKGSYGWWERIS
ncbi:MULTISPECIES: hypothetical protein [unclassified Pseudomonas]|uniref:hypothetical protein n=1 Tax=unclassified Pseudomonas TaxID=196821 RepID=UPI0021C80BF5|nr:MULTISPECIES: hypothetical protein [unclassified Pseudomonas]MCU1733146.1 hypothetical protein [Pseudomonas sp. 20P_3.2_Bac4]MCU1746816.1 hypothetical protein [Pseudomonas sp. 20P_3.2_Bac5]